MYICVYIVYIHVYSQYLTHTVHIGKNVHVLVHVMYMRLCIYACTCTLKYISAYLDGLPAGPKHTSSC